MAENAYNDLAAQTAQRQAEAETALRKRMADLGLASAPLTLQSQSEMAAKSNLGAISKQKQAQDEFNRAMRNQAELGLEAQQTSATAQKSFLDTQTSATLESIRGFGAAALEKQGGLASIQLAQQQAMVGTDIGFAKAGYALDDENRKREMYYKLFMKGKLSAKQFKGFTGIDIKAFSSGRKKATSLFARAAQNVQGTPKETQAPVTIANAERYERQVNDAKKELSSGRLSQPNYDKRVLDAETRLSVTRSARQQGDITYSDVLNDVTSNMETYVTAHGRTEYDRVVNYLQFRVDAQDNKIDLDYFAPGYKEYASLIEQEDEYVAQYGRSGYNLIVNTAYSRFKNEMGAVRDAIELKNSGAFTSDVLALSPKFAAKYQYTNEPEDRARQKLGLVPLALEKDAKSIIKAANSYQIERVGEIDGKGTVFAWETEIFNNEIPTQEDLMKAVKYLEWQDRYNAMDEKQRKAFDKLSVEDQQAEQDRYFNINRIEYEIKTLAPEDLAQVAVSVGLPETATPEQVVGYFRNQQEELNKSRIEMGLPSNATTEDVRQANIQQVARNLGLPPTATIQDVQAEQARFNADPIGWTNAFFDKQKTNSVQTIEQIEAERDIAVDGIRQMIDQPNFEGDAQAELDRVNAIYDGKVKAVSEGLEAQRKQTLDFINKSQEIQGYDRFKSNPGFAAIATDQLNKWKSTGFGKVELGFMTDDQRQMYAFLSATDKKEADKYLKLNRDSINSEMGKQLAKGVTDVPVLEQVFGLYAGTVGFFEGVGSALFGAGEVSPTQYASQYIRQDMINDNEGFNRFMYDLAYSAGNMAPSIGLSMMVGGAATPTIGSAVMGLGAGGNAYAEAIRMGYNNEQASAYGTLIGLSEGFLQRVLGGISQLSGTAAGLVKVPVVSKLISGINNVYARTAARLGVQMASEGTEEYLQEIIDPLLRNSIFGENNEIDPFGADKFEAALMGAIMALGFSGGGKVQLNQEQRIQKITDSLKPVIEGLSDGTTKSILTKTLEDIQLGTPQTEAFAGAVEAQNAVQSVSPQAAQTVDTNAETAPTVLQDATQPFERSVVESAVALNEARMNADEAFAAIKQLKNTGRVEVAADMSLTQTLDALKSFTESVGENIGDLKNIKMLRINTKGLLASEIRDIGKALERRDTTVRDLKKVIKGIETRMDGVLKKAQSTFINKVDWLRKKSTGDVKTTIDNLSEKYDVKNASDKTREKLQTAKDEAIKKYGSEDKIPLKMQQEFAVLNKTRVSDLTANELQDLIDEVDALKVKFDYTEGEQAQRIIAERNAKIDRMVATLPPDPKAWNDAAGLIGSPQRLLLRFGPEGRDIVARGIFAAGKTSAANNMMYDSIMNNVEKQLAAEFGNEESIKPTNMMYDPTLDITLPRSALFTLYLHAKDADWFKAIVEGKAAIPMGKDTLFGKGKTIQPGAIDGPTLQSFVANFAEENPDLVDAEKSFRSVKDFYKDPLNEAARRVFGEDKITQKMERDNPEQWPGNVAPSTHTIEIGEGKQGGLTQEPGILKERTGGGTVLLVNPLWTMREYHRQANLFTSYAVPVHEASKILNAKEVRDYMAKMGNVKGKAIPAAQAAYNAWLTDVANGRIERTEADQKFAKVIGTYNKAQLSFNPQVIFAQVASLTAAKMYVDFKYLLNPRTFKEAVDTIAFADKRDALFKERPEIYDRLTLGHSLQELGTDVQSYMNRIFNGKGIRYADAVTVTAIWLAAKKQQASTGIDAETAFQNALWNTQPMFEAPFRSQAQKGVITGRILGAFTTQSFQQHNMMVQAKMYYNAAKDAKARGDTKKAAEYWKTSKGAMAGTATSIGLFAALKATLAFGLAGAGRDDKDEKSADAMKSIAVGSLFGTLTPVVGGYVPSIYNAISKLRGSDSRLVDYGMSPPLMRMLDIPITAVNVWSSDKYTIFGRIMETGTAIAELFGVPAENIEKYVSEAAEDILGSEYDYLKKPPTVNDLAKDYVYSGGKLPDKLPESQSVVYDMYWDIIKDRKVNKDEEPMVKRLRSISTNISGLVSAESLYNAIKTRAKKSDLDDAEIREFIKRFYK